MIISDIKSEKSIDEAGFENSEKHKDNKNDEFKVKNLIKKILHEQYMYRFYKLMQRFANIYYSKIMLNSILILSIMSNTLISLGYIIVLCVMMYSNKMFINVKDARKVLNPILKNFVLNYMILEMLMQLVYQVPLTMFQSAGDSVDAEVPSIIGILKYYKVNISGGNPTLDYIQQNKNGVT